MSGLEKAETAPRVDVCVPTYRRPRYLAAAIESVLGQTHPNVRLTISEDGPGEAQQIVEPYLADGRVRFFSSGDEHLGSARNHTKLLGLAEGPYSTFLHDDDLWDPEFLERRVRFLEAHPRCGFVFSGNTQVDEEGREIGQSRFVFSEGLHEPEETVPALLRHNIIGGMNTLLARRSAYDAVGPAFVERWDDRFYDWEMHLRFALRFPLGYLHVRDAHYRVHGDQIAVEGRWRGNRLSFYEHMEALVAEQLPQVTLTEGERRARRCEALLATALDSVEVGERRRAFGELAAGVRARPKTLLRPKPYAIVAGCILGDRGHTLFGRLRTQSRRRSVRRGATKR